jgi:hypothetical protein
MFIIVQNKKKKFSYLQVERDPSSSSLISVAQRIQIHLQTKANPTRIQTQAVPAYRGKIATKFQKILLKAGKL